MKTVVFFGSARKKGHTKAILDHLIERLDGEVFMIDAYREKNIRSCVDCRHCWKVKACTIKDDMQEVYKQLDEADNLIIASPVYFHSITGELKAIIDRLQVYWAGHFRKDRPENYIRKGAYILVGGAPLFDGQFEGSEIVCRNVLEDMSTECVGKVLFDDSDHVNAKDNPKIIEAVEQIAAKLNVE